jgi:hypothetical protein
MYQLILTDIYSVFYAIAVEWTLFSAAHETFSKIDKILRHKEGLNKHKIEIVF